MTILEYLLKDKFLNKPVLAALVWPEKPFPEEYLQEILLGIRPFTNQDAIRVYQTLQRLADQYKELDGDYPDEE